MPTPVLPRPIKIARTALLAQSTLTAAVDTWIKFAIPSPWPTNAGADRRIIVLELVDSNEDGPYSLQARVQVNCWGAGNSTLDVENCEAVAALVTSVARDLTGTWAEGRIANAVPGSVIPAPDPVTGRARFIVDLLLTIYP